MSGVSDSELIFWKEIIPLLKHSGRPMAEKYIKFAIDDVEFPKNQFSCKDTNQPRTFSIIPTIKQRGNWRFIKKSDVADFIHHLQEMSVDLTFEDVKYVFKEYQETLKKPRKMGMRGQRNFTGKIEDEIRGKLSEVGVAKFCYDVGKIQFEPDFTPLEKGLLRDEGDFDHLVRNDQKISLPPELLIAVKSTAGYFALGLPQNEWSWPGGVYMSVRLHIDESFLLKLLNMSFGLDHFALSEKIGWVEIFGFVTKDEIVNSAFVSKRLPEKYHGSQSDWRLPNYIMHQNQFHNTRKEFQDLLKRYQDL